MNYFSFTSQNLLGQKYWQWLVRFIMLNLGYMLFGIAMSLMIKAHLGTDPWTVFHIGLAQKTGLNFGRVIQITGLVFIGLSILFFKQAVGLGTLLNMLLVGPWLDFFLPLMPTPKFLPLAITQLLVSIIILGFATALYINADLGAGPRDGFVLGFARKYKLSLKYTRFMLELTALIIGYILGGKIGLGTIIFAITIGPVMQFFLQKLMSNKTNNQALIRSTHVEN